MTNSPIVLRDYQKRAIEKILWAQTLEGNDLCVLPTGSGKSIVIAHLANELKEPILILQPSKEILEQNYNKLCQYVSPEDIGIYSASMDEKTIKFFTFATIQSIYKKAQDFAHFKIVIIDECHAVNPKNLDGMFTSFLSEIGNPKVIGFTATPYRMALGYEWRNGMLFAFTTIKLINRIKERFWSRLIFNVNNKDLLDAGYLAPLEYIDKSIIEQAEIPLNKSMSDFDLDQYENKIASKTRQILEALSFAETTSNSVLVFCSSVKQAERLQNSVSGSEVVTAKTPADERDKIVRDFKSGKTKIVFNVGVLTTGFDHPALDCIVLLRPTRSIALYYQMLGRGVRICDGKTSCKVIDMTSTVKNVGRIETIVLEKIEGKWELLSEAGSWHNRELYSFRVKK